MQKFKFPFVLVLIGGLLSNSVNVSAQRPPTGGPNPPPDTGGNTSFPVALYPVIGVVLGAATYYLVKKLPRKLPVPENLHAYLVQRHILPTPDALALMYALNPKLRGRDAMRPTRKLKAPEFPPVPETLLPGGSAPAPNSALLTKQTAVFREYRALFGAKRITVKAPQTSLEKIRALLADMESKLIAFDKRRDARSPVSTAMSHNLLQVLNQILRRSISAGVVSEQDAGLLQDVADNLLELMNTALDGQGSTGRPGTGYRQAGVPEKVYARAGAAGTGMPGQLYPGLASNLVWDRADASPARLNKIPEQTENMEQVFAFAIYKIDARGNAITRGPEVEGKYFIQYVPPALKAFENYYHNISPPPATYAAAKLPPAKFYLIVKDLQGNKVTLQNPLIDTRDIFRNPQRDYFKEMILVTIYVSP